MRLWFLYVVVSVAVLYVAWALSDECRQSDTGQHEDMWTSTDSDAGRRWQRCCLHCLRVTDGALIPWLRVRTFPTASSLRRP